MRFKNRAGNFNSRLYMRGSKAASVADMYNNLFQFTPLHERQPTPGFYVCYSRSDFNSRLYMRGSTDTLFIYKRKIIFQFTPLHERQLGKFANTGDIFYFNSRLYMRGSARANVSTTVTCNFNSRLYMRGSLTPVYQDPKYLNFNSRLYMRGSYFLLLVCHLSNISIHAST